MLLVVKNELLKARQGRFEKWLVTKLALVFGNNRNINIKKSQMYPLQE